MASSIKRSQFRLVKLVMLTTVISIACAAVRGMYVLQWRPDYVFLIVIVGGISLAYGIDYMFNTTD